MAKEKERERAIMCVKLACPLPCLLAPALRRQPSLWPLICHTALLSSIVFLEDVDYGLIMNCEPPTSPMCWEFVVQVSHLMDNNGNSFGVKLILLSIYLSVYRSIYPSIYLGFIGFIQISALEWSNCSEWMSNSNQCPLHCCLGLVIFLFILHK